MKLWLDDVRLPPNDEWTWAKTIDEAKLYAIWAQEFSFFEECSLDHDLGQGDQSDAIYFVDWMAEFGFWPKLRPKVHSMNPVGRMRMQTTIDRYFPD